MSPKDPKPANKVDPSPGDTADQSVVSIDELRIRRELPRVLPAFDEWCEERRFDTHGSELRARIVAFLEHYARVNSSREITFLNLPAFAATLDDLMFGKKANEFLEMTHVLGAYLEFLHTTGTWTGTHEEFQRVETYFSCFNFPKFEPAYSAIPELQKVLIRVPRLSQEEAIAGITDLAIASRVQSFLQWFGPKREITGAKILNRKHVQEAAAALDVLAVYDDSLTPIGGPSKNGPVRFKTARNVARLGLYWDALVGAGLIELSATRAYPSKETIDLLEDPAANLVNVVRRVAQQMYRAVSVEIDDLRMVPELGYLTRYFLLEAAVEPISVEVLKHPIRGLDDFDPRGTPDTIEVAWQNLEQLRDEGLVRIDAKLTIPPVLCKPLVLELANASEVEYIFKDPNDEDPDFTGNPTSWP
ncbi:hypothetical protein ACIPVK_10675 [Paeniglutamicibacter sp. MACA_103]|uniref:hypothetical protein n=1 Tax=Paeniglutamicibacter sp. MACA_103 TaxID=3377337 RepID=UPI003892D118